MKNRLLVLGLASLALGVANHVQRERHHKQHKHMFFSEQHWERLAFAAQHQYLPEIEYPGCDPKEAAQMLMANAWMSFWSSSLRLGYFTSRSLRPAVEHFMRKEAGRRYWEAARDSRRLTARDKHDDLFNEIADDAYHFALELEKSNKAESVAA